jgi:hypothetical protein
MDAPSFNGDDDREFGPDPDACDCESCGAGPDDVCKWDCDCDYCERQRIRQHPESA